ncbi:ubiquitin carboxyl-terminal hydrolase 2-like [Miscanthus floridulus]|uniref:ubiquitin carboxyl-terminal hydrolase 2-like n=1 Tax=Miscanthus floridulus TaxID=154761 RepID=UPI00345892F5
MEKKGRAKGGGSSDAERASNLKEYALMDEASRRLAFSEYVPLKEDQQQEGGADAKAQPKMRKGRKQLQKKEIGGADTKVKDGDEWDCWHCSNEDVSRLNKARLLMLSSKNAASCEHCQEDSSTNQQASGSKGRGDKEEEEEKKKKKKKGGDTRGAAAKDQTKIKNSDIWVCLECSRQFCGGADSSKPEGHVKLHCYENQHWWAAHYDDPTLIYCFKCRVEVVVRIPDVSLSQKKEKTEASYEPKATKSTKLMEGMGSNNPAQISSPSDQMDIPEMDLKLSLPITREEGKVASDPGEVSSPPSWDWGWDSGSDWDEETTATTKLMKGMGSDDPAQISPPSDQMAIPEMDLKLSPPIAREEDKGTSDTGEVSSPPSDKTEINQLSRPIDNQDIAISGSAATSMNVIKGLPSIGNSCFFNVMLQNLLGIDSLRCKILGSDLWMGPRVACLKQLFVETSTSYDAGVPLNPEILFAIICQNFPEFSGGTMHDNAELFGRFLGSLHDEETDSWQISMDDSNNGKVTTLVDSMFRGQECSTVSSRECPHESPKSQGFCLLQLTLPQLQDSTPVSIEDCFALYTKPDLLPAWHCEE